MILYNVPIEPLEERYSTQWQEWFLREFKEAGLFVVNIPGASTGTISRGSFLDVVDTNLYKLQQTMKLVAAMQDLRKDQKIVMFFHDLWHPGLTNIAYVRDGLGLRENVKICGCLHAGAYDENDFLYKTGMEEWAWWIEDAWFGEIVDKIFVATEYHKELLCYQRIVPADRVFVTGFPLYPDFVSPIMQKENIIVFPHRLDAEKQPELFDQLQRDMQEELPDWRWIKSKEVCNNKKEYYELLGHSKIAISFALQETWGIAMQEAALCGCVPIVPDRLSYTELYVDTFRYTRLEDVKMLVRAVTKHPLQESLGQQQYNILKRGREAIPKIIENIKKL
jgi:hypothetical protein